MFYNYQKNFISFIMIRLIITLFLVSFVFTQEVTINDLEVDSRQNGTMLNVSVNKKVNLELEVNGDNVSAVNLEMHT